MAGRGPAPKPRDQRRRRNEPERGEWITLKPLGKPILPALPKRTAREGPWSARTKRAWAAWRKDPATGMYGPAEIDAAIELAYVHQEMVLDPKVGLINAVRARMDSLGLSAKSKRDLRWRLPAEVDEVVDEGPHLAEVTPLRIVRGA